MRTAASVFISGTGIFEIAGSFSLQKKRDETMSRAKNPKYESMSLEELKANMEKSKKELEQAIHNMLEKTQKEQADIKKELSQNQSVLNTEEKLDVQSQQWSEDISEYVDIKELDANLLEPANQ